MIIRQATVEDARAIASIHVSSWQVAYRGIVPDHFLDALSVDQRETRWRQLLSQATTDVWVATDDIELLGWISVGKSRDEGAAPTTAELWGIYVDPRHWRHGVGRALWSQAKQHLAAAGFQHVTLWLLEQNQSALQFYAICGFAFDPGSQKDIELGGATLVGLRLRASCDNK